MNRESSFKIAAIIQAAVDQAVLEKRDVDYAIEIARANIDLLDQQEDKITLIALRKAVQQAWDRGANIL